MQKSLFAALTATAFASVSPAVLATLVVGVKDTGAYGTKFGSNSHRSVYEDTYQGTGEQLHLSVSGYDVDAIGEVSVYVNDEKIGDLRTTPDRGMRVSRFDIPATNGLTTLEFRRSGPGVVWGVTNILLQSPEGKAITLSKGRVNNGRYGFRFGLSEHLGILPANFTVDTTGELAVSVRGYDADSANKIAVYLDDSLIGYLPITGNRKLGRRQTMSLGNVKAGRHQLEFRVNRPGRTWGVSAIEIRDVAGPPIALSIGAPSSQKYGYKYGSADDHLGLLMASFPASDKDLKLTVKGYDVDFGNEVLVLLNGQALANSASQPYLSTGPNNALNAGDTFSISADKVSGGVNQLLFRQNASLGYRWGVTDISLVVQGSPSGGSSSSGSGSSSSGSSSSGGSGSSSSGSSSGSSSSSGSGSSSGSSGSSSSGSSSGSSSSSGSGSSSGSSGSSGSGSSSGSSGSSSSSGSSGGQPGGGLGPRPVAACTQSAARGADVTIPTGSRLKEAIEAAGPGQEIFIRNGDYRVTGPIGLKSGQRLICGDNVRINGSVRLTGQWTADGGLFKYSGAPAPIQGSGQSQPNSDINLIQNDLIIDDKLFLRVASKSQVNGTDKRGYDGVLIYDGTFYQSGTDLWVSNDPTGKKVEMSSASHAFFPSLGVADNVVMENCIVEKFATGDIDAAINLKTTRGWVLRNVTTRNNHTGGLMTGSDTTVLCGQYNHNGQTGITASLATGPNGEIYSYADDVVILGAEVAYNNWAKYNVQWHAGGAKFFLTDRVTVRDSHIHDNLGVGLWSDFDVRDTIFENNLLENNLSRAIHVEASYGASVKYNQVSCNTREADYSLDWSWFWGSQLFAKNSPNVEIAFNNVVVRDGQAIGVVDNLFRHVGLYGPQQALNNSVHDNTVTFEDVVIPVGDGFYEYFFQRTGVESDQGSKDCTPDSTLREIYSGAEIAAFVQQCKNRGGYDATKPSAGNSFSNNTYNYGPDYTHFRIDGIAYRSSNMPSAWEVSSTFNVGASNVKNLCN